MSDLDAMFRSIGIVRDYSTMDLSGLKEDLQGWNSQHPIFKAMLELSKPNIVVEVGTWKGASIIHMAKLAKNLGLETRFICVDTWLGSNDVLWMRPDWRAWLLLQSGYPSMFRQFIFNIIANGVADNIFPMPMTSICACRILKKFNITPDLIYIDAGHEEEEVAVDLKHYYDLLKAGGRMFGDDYGMAWLGVVKAVNKFCADKALPLNAANGKWHLTKPAETVAGREQAGGALR